MMSMRSIRTVASTGNVLFRMCLGNISRTGNQYIDWRRTLAPVCHREFPGCESHLKPREVREVWD